MLYTFKKIDEVQKNNVIPKNLAEAYKKILIQGNSTKPSSIYKGLPIQYFPPQYQALLKEAQYTSGKMFDFIAVQAIDFDKNLLEIIQELREIKALGLEEEEDTDSAYERAQQIIRDMNKSLHKTP